MAEYLTFKKSNCRNCYKCIRHCPVKSIRFSGNQAHIVSGECVLCGRCYVVCPQNAKGIADGTEYVRLLLSAERPVVASLAPSFAAYFEGCGIGAMRDALRRLGFADAEETAIGATLVKREYERQIAAHEQDVIVSSCCHSVNLLIRRYYPELMQYLSPVISPMLAHAKDIRRRTPEARVVFVGPCIAKKDEAEGSEVDAVITFEELSGMLREAGIAPEKKMDASEESRARLFPTVGGILRTMRSKPETYTYLAVDGMDDCKAVLEDLRAGNIHDCFIEMSACTGSCIGGPVMEKFRSAPVRHFRNIDSFAGKQDFAVEPFERGELAAHFPYIGMVKPMPSEREIEEILRKMGKTSPADELNCGSCGYNTCREKAIAVCQGKADVSMCLPYLMDKTERFSNSILANSPVGVLVLNEEYEVQQINRAAMKMLRIASELDVLGDQVVRIMNPMPFIEVMENGKEIKELREYYAEYRKYIELTVVHEKTTHILIAILRDVTETEKQRRQQEQMEKQTVEIADKVVEKQMRIVQEIASLLGETTAETKIALTKLKNSIVHEDEHE